MRGSFVIGIEKNIPEFLYSSALASTLSLSNLSFYRLKVDTATIESFPKTDVVLCLSIFHHWVKQYGVDNALIMLRSACSKAQTAFVFDTAQPEELDTQWPPYLSFMKPSGPEWINDYLLSCGFSTVHNVGEFKTSISSANRSLFIALR